MTISTSDVARVKRRQLSEVMQEPAAIPVSVPLLHRSVSQHCRQSWKMVTVFLESQDDHTNS